MHYGFLFPSLSRTDLTHVLLKGSPKCTGKSKRRELQRLSWRSLSGLEGSLSLSEAACRSWNCCVAVYVAVSARAVTFFVFVVFSLTLSFSLYSLSTVLFVLFICLFSLCLSISPLLRFLTMICSNCCFCSILSLFSFSRYLFLSLALSHSFPLWFLLVSHFACVWRGWICPPLILILLCRLLHIFTSLLFSASSINYFMFVFYIKLLLSCFPWFAFYLRGSFCHSWLFLPRFVPCFLGSRFLGLLQDITS